MGTADICILLFIGFIFIYAHIKGVNPYEAFIDGAKTAIPTVIKIIPCLAVMMASISIFNKSGAMNFIAELFKPLFKLLHIPTELIPLVLMRPLSGNAGLALLNELMLEYSADSFIGRAASVLVGSTETIFYTFALYCGSVGITKGRYAFAAAIISNVVGILVSVILVRILPA